MGLLPDIGYPQTGDVADPGIYACMNCDQQQSVKQPISIILNRKKKLPKCKYCGVTYWFKL